MDKAAWGPGPWQEEPDRVEFTEAGLPCLLLRGSSWGNWCGYAAVPPGHPAHGKDFDGIDVEVHGGLTYAQQCSGEICHVPQPGDPDNVWWLGFDCAHAWDLAPGLAASMGGLGSYDRTYKTVRYVERETRRLARQLAAMATP
jgi:hypothetical protein